jgi:RNA polymerase sigma factor for flagellar operon FliA
MGTGSDAAAVGPSVRPVPAERALADWYESARREQLILQYTPLVRHVVSRLGVARAGVLDTDDLVAAGMVGLVEAADRFDPDAGVKFETFAYFRVRGAVLDQARALDWVPRSVRRRSQAMAATRARLETENGRTPAEVEMAGALGIGIDQYRAAQAAAPAALLSLDAPLDLSSEGGDEALVLADTVAGGATDPASSLEDSELHACLIRGLRELPERDRILLSLYYERELTMKEISLVMGISEARVCQLHARALQRLRHGLAGLLGDAWDDVRGDAGDAAGMGLRWSKNVVDQG